MKTRAQIARGTLAAALFAAVTAAAMVPSAQAAPAVFCKDYSRAAVHQYKRSLTKGCGYSGWRWHGWKGGHYKWCRNTSTGAAVSERVARWRMLGHCW